MEAEKIDELTIKIQKECHTTVEMAIKANDKLTYQDITNVFIFRKIAELQVALEKQLENK